MFSGEKSENKAREARASNKILARTIVIMVFCGVIMFIPLLVQLYIIQIKEHDFYERRAVEQQTRDTVITPSRGTIYDRNMKTLAVSASVETVFISPAEIKDEEQEKLIASGLSEILSLDYDSVLQKTKNKKSYYVTIKKKIDQSLSDKIRLFIDENKVKGIHLEPDTKRYYPYGNFAANVIGFVRDDNVGAEGIEAYYEEYLRGVKGRIVSAKTRTGTDMPFNYEKYYDAQNGMGVVLTIDETIQHFLEKHLETAMIECEVTERGAGIVMNVKTGEILAMATKGDYDPNNPRTLLDDKIAFEIDQLTGDERTKALGEAQMAQWRNKPVVDGYEPGSTFKIITTAIALEEGVVSLNDRFFCSGSARVEGWPHPISCWKRGGHGSQTFTEGVENSCNPVFIAVGQRIGSEKFYEYMQAFGFMDKTGVDLPGESKGIIADYKTFSQSLVPVSTYAFGQTFTITPLQLITAVSGIANEGKMMKPHIVKAFVDSEGVVQGTVEPEMVRQVVSAETSKTVCSLLEGVVNNGTGSNAYVKGYRVGGKTGTGEKRSLPAEKRDGNYVVSFMAIAPCDDPEIAVLIILDHPVGAPKNLRTGGTMVAPVVGKVLADILPYMGIETIYTEEELKGADVTVPHVINLSEQDAAKAIKNKGMKYTKVGNGETVTDQVPAPGVTVPNTAEVILYMGEKRNDAPVKVPALIGMTPEQVNKKLADIGLYLRATGATSNAGAVTATWQSIAENTEVPVGTVVEVTFHNKNIED